MIRSFKGVKGRLDNDFRLNKAPLSGAAGFSVSARLLEHPDLEGRPARTP